MRPWMGLAAILIGVLFISIWIGTFLFWQADATKSVEKRGYPVASVHMRFPFSGCYLHKDRMGWEVTAKSGEHFKVCNGDFFWGTVVTPE